MKTGVLWIIRIYQVDYLWVKSQANVCLRRVWKLGTLNFFLPSLLEKSEKMSWKSHWISFLNFCMNHDCSNWGRIWIRIFVNKRHPMPHRHQPVMGCLVWGFWENWPCFYGTALNYAAGPCITNVFVACRKNFSQWHRSFQRKFLRHVAITLVIQGPGPGFFILFSFVCFFLFSCSVYCFILWF